MKPSSIHHGISRQADGLYRWIVYRTQGEILARGEGPEWQTEQRRMEAAIADTKQESAKENGTVKTFWKTVLATVIKVLPLETIVATVLNAGLGLLQKQLADPAKAAETRTRITTIIGRVANQLAVVAAAIEDGTITPEEASAILTAWQEQLPTPAVANKILPD